MRTPLTADQLAEALATLPGWSGDLRRLERTVLLPPDRAAALRARVAAAADELDHHPVVEDVPGGLRFVVWTHVRDAVTELDVALARRIDALLQ
ncbi:MAG: putative pterin-4-alpha-carbinolamine dehydratase [Frankiales bacterium]|nr:putative pterin-4-alpha-carbinolamine dehydratase [Frankiales bacterium]